MKHEINDMALRRMITYLAYLKSFSGYLPQYVSAPMIADALQLGEVQVGILNVSSDMLYIAVDSLQDAGVQAIWNFSPVPMAPRENIQIRNENLLPSLGIFSYFAKNDNAI